jgi:hypothetical protein
LRTVSNSRNGMLPGSVCSSTGVSLDILLPPEK